MRVLTPDRRECGLMSVCGNAVVKTVRKLHRATLVKVKKSLDNVNAAVLAQIDLSCAFASPTDEVSSSTRAVA